MSTAGSDEFSEILDRIKNWSLPSRIALAGRILESLDTPGIGVPVESVVGLLRTDRDPPSDEECRRIVEEERWRKYGR